ncbi:MAG: accessory regulator AgrB [Clostridium sp.]|nr:accessory regulator AgrB [Clostridium sp.]
MIKKLSTIFINYICENNYSNTEKEEMNYILITFIFEFLKAITLLLLFSYFGYLKETLLIIFMFFSIKPFIGGYHEDTQVACFFISSLEISIILFLSFNNIINFYSNIILLLISLFSIYHQAPIINPRMPIVKEKIIKKNRIIGLSSSTLFSIISILIYNIDNNYSKIITWTLILMSQLMFNKRNPNKKTRQ